MENRPISYIPQYTCPISHNTLCWNRSVPMWCILRFRTGALWDLWDLSIMFSPCSLRIMYVLEWRIVSALTRGLFWCLFPKLGSNEGSKCQNNARVSTEMVHHERTYIIIFLTRHNESINDYKKDKLYTSFPCFTHSVFVLMMTSQSIADDVTMTRQLWCDHMNSDISILFTAIFTAGHVRLWYIDFSLSVCPSILPAVSTLMPTILDGFFSYLTQIITSMRALGYCRRLSWRVGCRADKPR